MMFAARRRCGAEVIELQRPQDYAISAQSAKESLSKPRAKLAPAAT
jgi:hypothetical protein